MNKYLKKGDRINFWLLPIGAKFNFEDDSTKRSWVKTGNLDVVWLFNYAKMSDIRLEWRKIILLEDAPLFSCEDTFQWPVMYVENKNERMITV